MGRLDISSTVFFNKYLVIQEKNKTSLNSFQWQFEQTLSNESELEKYETLAWVNMNLK